MSKRSTTEPATTKTDTPESAAKKGKVDPPKDWRVDVLQVPCDSKGDCSIHVLLSKDPTATDWTLENAVLMDGGKTPTSKLIPVALDLYQKRTKVSIKKFDAWVVTHWDGDHYEGGIAFFNENKTFLTGDIRCYCPDWCTWTGSTPSRTDPPSKTKDKLKALFDIKGSTNEELERKWTHDDTGAKNNLIGLDLFTGERLFNVDDKDPLAIIAGRANAARPVLACLGSNANIATGGMTKGAPTSYMNGTSVSEYVNNCSIITLTLWPERFSATGNKKATYYSAGDGCRETEAVLLKYLTSKGVTVEALKATHHGSSHQFSKDFFLQCKPQYWLVSPGSKHGHPTAAVLLQLAELMCQHPFKIYPSRMLYWYRDQVSRTSMNEGDFVTELKAYKQEANPDKLAKDRNSTDERCQRAWNICTVLASLGLAEQTPLGNTQELTLIDTEDDYPSTDEAEVAKLSDADKKKRLERKKEEKKKLFFQPGYMAFRDDKKTKITDTDIKDAAQGRRESITQWGESLWNLLTDGIVAKTFNVLLDAETKALNDELAKLPATATPEQKAAVKAKLDALPPPSPDFPYWLHTLVSTKDKTEINTEEAGKFRS